MSTRWMEHALHETALLVSTLEPHAAVRHYATGLKAQTAEVFRR